MGAPIIHTINVRHLWGGTVISGIFLLEAQFPLKTGVAFLVSDKTDRSRLKKAIYIRQIQVDNLM
jgi:hypothetical protein